MPDGDRFLRRLAGTGRGWGKVAKLACVGKLEYLPEFIIKALADNFRRYPEGAVPGAINAVVGAIERESWSKKDKLMSSAEVSWILNEEIRRLRAGCDYDLAGLLGETAVSVFNATKNNCEAIDRGAVLTKFVESLAFNIMDSRCWSRVRNDLMEKSGRTPQEQLKWEQNLKPALAPDIHKMAKNASKCEFKNFRAPARRRKRVPTSEILHKTLRVLPSD